MGAKSRASRKRQTPPDVCAAIGYYLGAERARQESLHSLVEFSLMSIRKDRERQGSLKWPAELSRSDVRSEYP